MPESHGWDVHFEYSVHKKPGFCGWVAEFSQSIHKLWLFHGWDAVQNDVPVHENRLFHRLDTENGGIPKPASYVVLAAINALRRSV